jgi:pantetheine-phosphate adenylyltransferase
MKAAVFPGSFDPPTNGHLNIIHRASKIFDRLLVVVSANPTKKSFFSAEKRAELLTEMVKDSPNVKIFVWDKLIVDFAQTHGAKVLIRGVRALTDFGYEFELALVNKGLGPEIETLFIPTDSKYFVLRSSFIKELAMLETDISSMVPKNVEKAVLEQIKANKKAAE